MLYFWISAIVVSGFVGAVVARLLSVREFGFWYLAGRIDHARLDPLVAAGAALGGDFDDPIQIFAEQIHETGLGIEVAGAAPWDGNPRIEIVESSVD